MLPYAAPFPWAHFFNAAAVAASVQNTIAANEINDPSVSTTAPDAVGDSTTDCVVCGDKSSGKHYGQFSCEGCKSFFKRSIRRSLSYTCRASKNCAIDVQHRNQCQYCRLKKCIRMGMRKEAVQRGRLPVSLPSLFVGGIASSSSTGGTFASLLRPPPSPFLAQFAPHTKPKDSTTTTIFEFAAQTVFATVNWARNSMSGVLKADQIALVCNSWRAIFVFALANSPFAGDLAAHVVTDDVADFQKSVDRVREYTLDLVELSSIRAILLFDYEKENGGELAEATKIGEVAARLRRALEEYCRVNKGEERYGQLVECVRHLQSSGCELPISRLFFAKLVGATPIESIIGDLLAIPVVVPPPIMFPSVFK